MVIFHTFFVCLPRVSIFHRENDDWRFLGFRSWKLLKQQDDHGIVSEKNGDWLI